MLSIAIIFVSGFQDPKVRTRVLQAGVWSLLSKTFNDDSLIERGNNEHPQHDLEHWKRWSGSTTVALFL